LPNLTIKAGPGARRWISEHGLYPNHVRVIPGAAGGPKWIVLAGLDRFLFGEWLHGIDHSIDLIGSSIGAWRFAMGAQRDPAQAMARFREIYFQEWQIPHPTPADISEFSDDTLAALLGESGAEEILGNQHLRLHTVVARTPGLFGSDQRRLLVPGLAAAVTANLVSRRLLKWFFERVLFHHPSSSAFRDLPLFSQENIPLTSSNLRGALLATGSIPLVMEGVFRIDGAPAGCYRDGGIIDYHLDLPYPMSDGIVLYPHYTDRIIPGWFDKPMQWRKPAQEHTDRMVLLSPSREFIASLPHGKIPDRGDFARFAGREAERVRYWEEAFKRSLELANELAELLYSGNIESRIEPL